MVLYIYNKNLQILSYTIHTSYIGFWTLLLIYFDWHLNYACASNGSKKYKQHNTISIKIIKIIYKKLRNLLQNFQTFFFLLNLDANSIPIGSRLATFIKFIIVIDFFSCNHVHIVIYTIHSTHTLFCVGCLDSLLLLCRCYASKVIVWVGFYWWFGFVKKYFIWKMVTCRHAGDRSINYIQHVLVKDFITQFDSYYYKMVLKSICIESLG